MKRHGPVVLLLLLLASIPGPAAGRAGSEPFPRLHEAPWKGWLKGLFLPTRCPVDLRFLNAPHRPAGKTGFVRAKGGRLYYGDGSPARFWGCNVQAYSLFSSRGAIRLQAERIARLGFNLVRLHHHDSTGWVDPTVIDKSRPDTRHLNPAGLDGIDWWIKCLKDQGVFVWLDLHVGRLLKKGDAVKGWKEVARRGGDMRGFCFINDSIEARMEEFNRKYLSHVNRFTGKAYKDEPAVMGILITNENDLTGHFGNLFLPDKNNPFHNGLFMKEVKSFAAKTGLPAGRLWRTWEPGPSKILLADLEHRWFAGMLGALRKIGVRQLVAPGNTWGNMALFGLPSLRIGDIVDVHSYGKEGFLRADPRKAANYVDWIAAAHVEGKPLSVTEWNLGRFPADDRFAAPLYTASIASFQGWDALMLYGYSQVPLDAPPRASNWSSFTDPALMGLMPAAALLFRRGDVAPGKKTARILVGRKDLYERARTPVNSAALRTLPELHRLVLSPADVPELSWDSPAPPVKGPSFAVRNLDRDFLGKGAKQVVSDTGELTRNWKAGFQVIDTPRTQAVQGAVGGRTFRLGAAVFKIRTPSCAVVLSSLDGRPLASSGKILLTALGRAYPSTGNRLPFRSEPVEGEVELAGGRSLLLYPLGRNGKKGRGIPLSRRKLSLVIRLSKDLGTHWFLLEGP